MHEGSNWYLDETDSVASSARSDECIFGFRRLEGWRPQGIATVPTSVVDILTLTESCLGFTIHLVTIDLELAVLKCIIVDSKATITYALQQIGGNGRLQQEVACVYQNLKYFKGKLALASKQNTSGIGKKTEKSDQLAVLHTSLSSTKNCDRLLNLIQTLWTKTRSSEACTVFLLKCVCSPKSDVQQRCNGFLQLFNGGRTLFGQIILLTSARTIISMFLFCTVYAKYLPSDYSVIVQLFSWEATTHPDPADDGLSAQKGAIGLFILSDASDNTLVPNWLISLHLDYI